MSDQIFISHSRKDREGVNPERRIVDYFIDKFNDTGSLFLWIMKCGLGRESLTGCG